jgi:chemotaxis protein MotB
MAEPTSPPPPAPLPKGNLPTSLPTAAGKSAAQAVAAGTAKTVASSAATAVAWKGVALATAAVLGLGGGGYYFNRDLKARSQLTEAEQRVATLDSQLKEATSGAEALRAQLDQARGDAEKAKKLALDLEQTKAELAKLKDLSDSEKKVLEQQIANQQLEMEKLQAAKAAASQTDTRLEESLKKELADKDVQISRLKDQLKVTVASEILFPSGSAELSQEGVDVLRKVAKAANKSTDEVRVEGHTDSDPIAPVLAQYYPTNWELSTARAAVAVRTLEATGMVPASRLSAVGYGDSRPVGPNETAEGKAKNRRVEIVFTPVKNR